MCSGREFQMWAAATGKARLPTVASLSGTGFQLFCLCPGNRFITYPLVHSLHEPNTMNNAQKYSANKKPPLEVAPIASVIFLCLCPFYKDGAGCTRFSRCPSVDDYVRACVSEYVGQKTISISMFQHTTDTLDRLLYLGHC